MTRYAIDALTAIRLARERIAVPTEHRLVAPKSLQTRALSELYRAVRRGELAQGEARAILDRITTMGIRLLGDRVSRAAAWRVAEQLDWHDIGDAEYVAVARLQADAFVTLDPDLALQVQGIITLAPFEALHAPSAPP
ncbi:type II toxin-antitoxin system VapC family toxin [Lacisediminihabitans sp.]|uniref:type II toxin-antitoxin system VapC family toxin n=1 Tax=Lacisediminihabitans sp. TaxID=2787631 RepID=UPI00374D9ED6